MAPRDILHRTSRDVRGTRRTSPRTNPVECVCKVTILDSSAPASRMDQTGSARSYLTSTTA
eukprot:51736-Chlamydomonas_euryale.AAC.1